MMSRQRCIPVPGASTLMTGPSEFYRDSFLCAQRQVGTDLMPWLHICACHDGPDMEGCQPPTLHLIPRVFWPKAIKGPRVVDVWQVGQIFSKVTAAFVPIHSLEYEPQKEPQVTCTIEALRGVVGINQALLLQSLACFTSRRF